MKSVVVFLSGMAAAGVACGGLPEAAQHALLDPASTPAGYLARLLINETPFPGEKSFRSEADSKATMQAVLWVLHARLRHVPAGYTQREVADVRADNIIDLITARGSRDQVQGFYKDSRGRFRAEPRVHERVHYLVSLARQGNSETVARLLKHAQTLAQRYFQDGPMGPDPFLHLQRVGDKEVTGRAYAWMTDSRRFHPGGDFVPIPETLSGSLGGNRFYTLEKRAR